MLLSFRLQTRALCLVYAKIMSFMIFLQGCGARSELWSNESTVDSPDVPSSLDGGPPLELDSQIAASASGFTCASQAGVAKCWGANLRGMLGCGNTDDKYLPTSVTNVAMVSSISLGHSRTCALLIDRSVYCWGSNNQGEVGDGTGCSPQFDCPDGIKSTPIKILDNGQKLFPSGPAYHACVQHKDSSVSCWGNNGFGQFCNGINNKNEFAPVNVDALRGAIEIRTGYAVTCAQWSSDSVRCCGLNDVGQLGDGTTTDRPSPTTVMGLSAVAQISVGQTHVCALLLDGTVKCWGGNAFGQLGNGTTKGSLVPVLVEGISSAVGISVNAWHSCAWLADGTAWCWGENNTGQLGDGTKESRLIPTQVVNLSDVVEMAAGAFHTCARRTNGEMLCWGRNAHGEIGDGTTEQRLVPTLVAW
jgi:alpha-tubulin suppressor-like RCC1 family protein